MKCEAVPISTPGAVAITRVSAPAHPPVAPECRPPDRDNRSKAGLQTPTVFVPITRAGLRISTRGSRPCAETAHPPKSQSRQITPPMYSPFFETQSNVVAVPKSTITHGPPYFSNAATAFTMRSAPLPRDCRTTPASRLHTRLNKQRLGVEIALAHLPQHRIERRHHRRNHNPMHVRDFEIFHGEEVAENHPVLVHGSAQMRPTRQFATTARSAPLPFGPSSPDDAPPAQTRRAPYSYCRHRSLEA